MHDRTIWNSLLYSLSNHIPLISTFARDPATAASQLSTKDLERFVISTYRIDRTWLQSRGPPISLSIRPKLGIEQDVSHNLTDNRTILSLDTIDDRWLLCVYHERFLELWDLLSKGSIPTNAPADIVCCLCSHLPGDSPCTSSRASLDEDQSSIILAVTSNSVCNFFRVVLPVSQNNAAVEAARLESIASIQMTSPTLLARSIYPPGQLAFFSYSNSFMIVNWNSHMQWPIDVSDQHEEELWNGVIGAEFVTPRHIICVKAHAVELYTLPVSLSESYSSPSIPGVPRANTRVRVDVLSHSFPNFTFRGVSLSTPRFLSLSNRLNANTSASLNFLAYDVLRGLFLYRVSLLLPPLALDNTYDVPPPHMSASLLAAHHMAMYIGKSTGNPATTSTSLPRSGMTPGTRGFVSTCVLGRTGRRGLWVERKRGSVRRGVVGFSTPIDAWDRSDDLQLEEKIGGEAEQDGNDADNDADAESEANWWDDPNSRFIDGNTIFEVNSYDLRGQLVLLH
ncbi:uncharacterized protein FIBRA_04693 [Fibroporia radiculosa]|uniref:Uncharacterized protein n=1 Tax=Fibroporia radiculosa TaxID=599839 RepID=J4GPN5_9APHY|nr:uncharacterized protein FIBRA_04693 [Fibroporia radiculosa]CCM02590.1 predicted protein [Fibroporia radiculosa]